MINYADVFTVFPLYFAEHPELLNAQKEKDEQLLARLIGANVVPEKITVRQKLYVNCHVYASINRSVSSTVLPRYNTVFGRHVYLTPV